MSVRKNTISLEARLCMLMVGTIFVVLLGIGHLAMREQRDALLEQKTQSFEATAKALSVNASKLVKDTDGPFAKSFSSQVKNSNMELEYVLVSDRYGHSLYAESENMPKHLKKGMKWWTVVRKIVGYSGIDENQIQSVKVPVELDQNRSGTFIAGFRLASVNATIDSVQTKIIIGLTLGLLVGIIYAMVLGRSMSNALRALTKSAKAVSIGNFSFRVESDSNDELGQLADAFNYMLETVETSQVQLIERANTDSLTGLFNHRYFQERLTAEAARAARYGHNLCLMMLDIDYFKNFNDTHGHPMGDSMLRDLAQIMIANTRTTDIAVRYGGEEFAVILPETSAEEALEVAERIRFGVERHKFNGMDGQKVSVTISTGIAEYPTHCQDRTGLIIAADLSLYQSKAEGRNRVTIFKSDSPDSKQVDPYKLYVLLQAHDMDTIEALSEAIDAKLRLPSGHSKTVAKLAKETARHMGLQKSDCEGVYLASLLRDIGQIVIPDAILAKNGPLTSDEMKIVADHPTLGHSIVQKASNLTSMLPAILHHHEKYDGSGYPSALKGENIPLPARIIAVADAYQAMLIPRPHRSQLNPDIAQAELVEKSSTQFDGKVVQAFLEVIARKETIKQAA